MNYFPITLPILFLLLFVAAFLVFLIEVGVLRYAYERMGVDRRLVYGVILLSFFGSYLNLPVWRLPDERVLTEAEVVYYGMRYVIPLVERSRGTLIAVNVGGAILPTALSAYLVAKNRMWLASLAGVAVVAVVVHALAHPVRGVGIAEPVFVPPVVAAGAALALSWPQAPAWRQAPALAYVAGTMGTLIGADLTNLDKIRGLGAPVAAIGGAGTFDGIFVTGILAVLMASLFVPRGSTPAVGARRGAAGLGHGRSA